MKAPSQEIIDNLQSAAEMLAHLAMQYRVDKKNLKALGLDWLAGKVAGWYHETEEQLDKVNCRLLYFDTDPSYDVGEVAGADDVVQILERDYKLTYDAHEAFCGFRKTAWDTKADYTPDIYEHALKEMGHQARKIEMELALLKKLGEQGYISGRLEDE